MKIPARRRRGVRIEMVPLIDVVFLLLVFFVYAFLSMIVPRGLHVKLPRVEGASRTAREPVAVSIGRRGELFVDREPVEAGELVAEVKARLRGASDRWVVVQGDARAPLESALQVLGRLRDGGIEQATFRVGAPPALRAAPSGQRRRPDRAAPSGQRRRPDRAAPSGQRRRPDRAGEVTGPAPDRPEAQGPEAQGPEAQGAER